MLRMKLLFAMLVILLSMGLAGNALAAGLHDIGSEAGLVVISNSDYVTTGPSIDQAVGPHASEAGVWKISFDAPETKAEVAARHYNYDEESLMRVGTEGGTSGALGSRNNILCGSC